MKSKKTAQKEKRKASAQKVLSASKARYSLLKELRSKDKELVSLFSAKILPRKKFREQKVSSFASLPLNAYTATKIEAYLEKSGALEIKTTKVPWRDTDGERKILTIVRAAGTKMWPMGTNYWVKDNAFIGARLLLTQKGETPLIRKRRALGKEILLSALTIMSSCSQLKRFNRVISAKSQSERDDVRNWPQIFLGIKDNLTGEKYESWAHKQLAWQALAYFILEAIKKKAITLSELSKKQKQFLSLLVPFLSKIEFWNQETSGDWEELVANRSSVIIWDTILVSSLKSFATKPDFAFLLLGLNKAQKHLSKADRNLSFSQLAEKLLDNGSKRLAKLLPFESPGYPKKDLRYRQSDATLIYALLHNIPQFIGTRLGKSKSWILGLERKILASVMKLRDPQTGGIARYKNDAYQRVSFFTHETIFKLSELYGTPSGNASLHFAGREKIVPKGREAAWTHFVWQLCAWSAERYKNTQDKKYLRFAHERLVDGLRLITGKKEVSIDQDISGKPRIIPIKEGLIPECYISERSANKKDLIFPSPHTPLNWAVGEALFALAALKKL